MNVGMAKRRASPIAAITAAALLTAVAAAGAASMPDAAAQQDAACREGLESIMKNADGSMACVSPGTKAVLIERGWGSEPMPAMPDAPAGMDAAAGMDDGMDMGTGMDDGMTAMSDDAMGDGMSGTAMPDVPEIALTDAESERLTGSEIRVAYDPYRIPIELHDEAAGLYDPILSLGGVSGAYLGWVDAALPADFAPVDVSLLGGDPGAPVRPNEAVQDGIADVVMALDPTEEMREYMLFTAPHTTLPIVMATADGTTLEVDSLSGMDVGAVTGYGAARWLDSISVEYKGYATGIEAIEALRDGEIDVFVGLWEVAFSSGMMAAPPVDVTNAGETGQSEMLSIGYAASDANLGSALDKALASVPDEMRELITAMASMDPAEVFGDPDAFTEAFGGDETASSFAAIPGEIDDLNSAGDDLVPELLNLPEAVAFVEKHPEYATEYLPFGFEEVEVSLTSNDGASLRIGYSLVDDKPTEITYQCAYPDGATDSYMGDDLVDKLPTMCMEGVPSPNDQ